MANIQHNILAGIELHEPKGAAGANANSVYVFNGSGSGVPRPLEYTLNGTIASISSASSIILPLPFKGNVVKAMVVLGGAITGANSTITVKNSTGANITTLTVPHASSVKGTTVITYPSTPVAAETYVTVETNGASTGAQTLSVLIVVEKT